MGLGTGRRGMKSPPLLIAVLLACVFVLGINYWITSSRCVELQNQMMELERRMRRAAAERGAVETKKNEYEDMLAKQKKQIETIQSLHSGQMQTIRSLCDSEKDQLLNNITAKDNIVQTLQVEISNAHKRLEDFKNEFKDLEDTQAKKLAYELSQCSYKIAEVKEQCEERVRKAKDNNENPVNDEAGKNVPKVETEKPPSNIQVSLKGSEEKEEVAPPKNVAPELSLQDKNDNEKKAGSSLVNKENAHKLEVNEVEKIPAMPPQNPKPEAVVEDEEEQGAPNKVKPQAAGVAGAAGAAEEEEGVKSEEIVEKDGNNENDEVDREHLINRDEEGKDAKQNKPKGQENYYDGDDANEKDKQAELSDKEPNLKDKNPQKDQTVNQEDNEAIEKRL